MSAVRPKAVKLFSSVEIQYWMYAVIDAGPDVIGCWWQVAPSRGYPRGTFSGRHSLHIGLLSEANSTKEVQNGCFRRSSSYEHCIKSCC